MSIKARMLGVYKEFTTTIKAFQKAQQKLANEYQRINAKRNGGMVLDFASDGKPLATIDNFVQVIENDSKFDNLRFNHRGIASGAFVNIKNPTDIFLHFGARIH